MNRIPVGIATAIVDVLGKYEDSMGSLVLTVELNYSFNPVRLAIQLVSRYADYGAH